MKGSNLILITCHDLGRFLGCYGVTTVQTPNLDRLASEGVLFEQAYCTAPQCSPSRASLFTGRYPHNNGMMGLTNVGMWDIHPEERHLAEMLQEAGYITGLAGIYHETLLDPAERFGFDEVCTSPRRGEAIAAEAIHMLEQFAVQERPFFLEIGFFEPHRIRNMEELDYMGFTGGYIEPDEERDITVPGYLENHAGSRKEMAELQGAVKYMDAQIGLLMEKLKAVGRDQDTVVLFTTDHGLALPRAKCSLYDSGLEVALLLRVPGGRWQGGQRIDNLVSNIDIVPTLLDLLELPVPGNVQGVSIAPLLDNDAEATSRDCIFGEMTYHDYYDPRRCIRTARYKLIINFSGAPYFMNPSQSWRPRTDPVFPEKPALHYHEFVELYDLEADAHELDNRAEDPVYADIKQQLSERLLRWMADTSDPLLQGAVTSPHHRLALSQLTHYGA
ncbi:sulfatase family protein [Paenibacillus sp. strain BS8-2]